jgi:hypothetical protein
MASASLCSSAGLASVLGSATLDGYSLPCCEGWGGAGAGGAASDLAATCADANLHGAAGVDHNDPLRSRPVVPWQCRLGDPASPCAAASAARSALATLRGGGGEGMAGQAGGGGGPALRFEAHLGGHAVGADVSPLPRFTNDDVARTAGLCTSAVLQQHRAARAFREMHADVVRRFAEECGNDWFRPGCQAEQRMRPAYSRLREALRNASEEVVRQCLPRADVPDSVDALAAGVYRMAAIPGEPADEWQVAEDPARCAARVDLARHMCSVLPQRLLAGQAGQLRQLCGVDVPALLAGRLGDPQPADLQRLREALESGDPGAFADLLDSSDTFRFGPEDDPVGDVAARLRDMAQGAAGGGPAPAASPWCPVMLREAARELEALRARLTGNLALGKAGRVMCGNLVPAAACLGSGSEAAAAPTAAPAGPTPGEEEIQPPPSEEIRWRTPPGQRPRNERDVSDTVDVFADLLDASESNKAAVALKLGEVAAGVRALQNTVEVERLDGDEIVANTGTAEEAEHAGLCFVHCHARTGQGLVPTEAGGGPAVQRSKLNCRIFTPPNPGQSCQRALISVVDETRVNTGPGGALNLRARDGPAYDVIEGMLSQFRGCNVRRGGTENGRPVGARNVRLGPFAAERWAEAQARYGFCYVERAQLAAGGTMPEIQDRLGDHRQPSGNYMLNFATSHARQGGRMAQRECRMLLDVQQTICRQRFSTDKGLEALKGYDECLRLRESEEVGPPVGIPVPIVNPTCLPNTPPEDCPAMFMTVFQPNVVFPREMCKQDKIKEACGTIKSFSQGEPRRADRERLRDAFGVPDSSEVHCKVPTAPETGSQRAGSGGAAVAAGVPAEVGKQLYVATGWLEDDTERAVAKESTVDGCMITCTLENPRTEDEAANKAAFEACMQRCQAEFDI